ncbi:pogo transposable element with KRAB domain [Ditylenchus destructor]|uniref:Pogo transposable element with KRAB domain n=1 Tax=Ditylenchus destructor TaxID=166010 RepID=A0AAD4NFF8_9BILA|nr:pogo transposable element with KRAB domain [Ditylenchus destructor]
MFLSRHKFSARKETRRCQKPPAEYASKIADFVVYLSKLREQNNYLQIYACDETAVWLDPTSGKCVDYKGAKDVTVVSTGHEKARVTVMLTARADGTKSRPYVLLPRKRPVPKIEKDFGSRLHLAWAGRSWMNDEWTADFLRKTIGPIMFGGRLLVWDSIPIDSIMIRSGVTFRKAPKASFDSFVLIRQSSGVRFRRNSSEKDDLIHCMKPEGSVPSARDLLRKARESEVQLLIQEELDEEEDYNNGYESNAEIE